MCENERKTQCEIHVKVEQKHLDRAVRGSGERCPVALALADALPENVRDRVIMLRVGIRFATIQLDNKGEPIQAIELPPDVVKFIIKFDRGTHDRYNLPEFDAVIQTPYYIAMGGLHGCMPNHIDDYNTYEDAVEGLAEFYGFGRVLKKRLYEHGYLELNMKKHGNEYCEIVEGE